MKFIEKSFSVLKFQIRFSCKITVIHRKSETAGHRRKGLVHIVNLFLSMLTIYMDKSSSKPSCTEYAVKLLEINYTMTDIAEFTQYLSHSLFGGSFNFNTFYEWCICIEQAFYYKSTVSSYSVVLMNIVSSVLDTYKILSGAFVDNKLWKIVFFMFFLNCLSEADIF